MTLEQAIEKSIKLLRLSKSSNVNEASLAMVKAQEIIDRYKLDVNDLEYDKQQSVRDAEQVKDFGYSDALDSHSQPWIYRLCVVVCRFNQCKAIARNNIDDKGKNRGWTIKIVGCPSDAQTVRYLYGYLKQEVIRLCNENCEGNSATYKRHFCIGVVDAIQAHHVTQKSAMEKDIRATVPSQLALVRVNTAIEKLHQRAVSVANYCSTNMNLKMGRSTGYTKSAEGGDARTHGRKVGEQVRFTSAKGGLGSGSKHIGCGL